MGLKITSEIYTDGGTTSDAYVNIETVKVSKSGTINAFLNLYLNEEARLADPTKTVTSQQVYSRVGKTDDSAFTLTGNVYEVAYALTKEKLEAFGLTVIDSI
jgi:hypothetical protein